ncbi:hypothetical protein Rhopal_007171-T1 [Rhodotorula paludigena]|uniref:Transmembrane protein n=1 Tax=Rhodotorula paludigena TaxID=86838 RepID=A0AAV5GX78_9BASI|nr:hypothetical protein Rhopal_007171-T1 [Rhodotorula paludigena]
MSRVLTQIDMNRVPSSSSSSDDSQPATPSKDKMREWTFPRKLDAQVSSALASSASTPGVGAPQPHHHHQQQRPLHNFVEGVHAHTSSVARNHASSPSSAHPHGHPGSMDLRHRSNASLAFGSSSSPTKPLLPRLSEIPHAPADMAKLVYSNVRRRSIHDMVYLCIFGGCLVLFACALLGVGYHGPAAPKSSPMAMQQQRVSESRETGAEPVINVEIPASFLPSPDEMPAPPAPVEEYLADVHQPHGDSSHDAGEDHFQDSPDDPALSDEHVHHVHQPAEDPLWPEDPEHLEREAEEQRRARPRPARLPPQEDEDEALVVEEQAPEDDDEPLAVAEEQVVQEDEPEADILIDDTIDVHREAPAPGALHVVDADDEDTTSSLSALEELLDSAEEEEAEALAQSAAAAADRDELARAQRGREALARQQRDTAVDGEAEPQRFVQRKKRLARLR